ncbi:hypothetical protein ZYGR_0S01900 [Zygosaccharomyces rouxii]|uniref:ZYRO0F06732p n=2 Tax=Zygosaccharomyces rouxii TaxID=4956 RepID=C5DXP6_ZYGRC|nr:uncharacterized protein ZYRO0F06732g [Zygosaccharomyces rouxii]KAH9199316.1 hypothetical protein LQ764DRAFT_128875 [Zygosaccharomyces rouxii]GAV50056.1 hypothetical protein ZYGR_0S01900 [Zygosaccharomyces rouxii]CAR28557.1 ZYRO0F06732p [Zygosaccharomyces rouxii]
MTLQSVSPEPIDSSSLNDDALKSQDEPVGIPLFPISKKWVSVSLRKVQYFSTFPMSLYFPLHGINTLLVPPISAGSAPDDVLMMVRELLPSFTTKLLVTSLCLHFGSGLILRIWHWINNYYAKPRSKSKKHSPTKTDVHFQLQDESERVSQRVIGLTGGLSGYFTGFKKSFSLPPQILSGYILAPLLTYHLYVMKLIPDELKTDVDFNYVKWILQNPNWQVKWIGGIIPITLLIGSGTYHIFAGMCQYMGVKKLSSRRKWSNVITVVIASGIFGLYRLGKHLAPFVGSAEYEKVFQKIYLL